MITTTNLVISGSPGVGKTTLIKECVYPFADKAGGFITEEIKEGSERRGFLLKSLSGGSGVLAAKGLSSRHKVNKYGVDLAVLENIGVPEIGNALRLRQLVVIDEIGTMEMMSPLFCEAVVRALASVQPVLATIRLRAEPFTSQIKKMSNTTLLTMSKTNRDEIRADVRAWVKHQCR